MPPELPQFADDLALTFSKAFALLDEAARDRHSPMHTPSLASIGRDGQPRNRIVVLRHFDAPQRCLRFHTDIRSDKFDELTHDPRCAALFYHPDEKVQIRVEGRASLHHHDAIADSAWASSQAMSRHCYAVSPSPGHAIDAGDAFTIPKGRILSDEGRPHFAAVLIQCDRLEWLWLGSDGHRRARFVWSEGASEPASDWLVP
jgi:pyridoxamine 5'-phosphate oxidase